MLTLDKATADNERGGVGENCDELEVAESGTGNDDELQELDVLELDKASIGIDAGCTGEIGAEWACEFSLPVYPNTHIKHVFEYTNKTSLCDVAEFGECLPRYAIEIMIYNCTVQNQPFSFVLFFTNI